MIFLLGRINDNMRIDDGVKFSYEEDYKNYFIKLPCESDCVI